MAKKHQTFSDRLQALSDKVRVQDFPLSRRLLAASDEAYEIEEALHALYAAALNGGRGSADAIKLAEPFVNHERVRQIQSSKSPVKPD